MALSANRNAPYSDDRYYEEDVAASVHIFKGGIVSQDTSGNFRPGRATVTDKVIGIATQERDNSAGAAGALRCRVEAGVFGVKNSAGGDEITNVQRGETCYVVDDETVAKTSSGGTRPSAGRVVFVEGGLVYVYFGRIKGADGDLLAANDLSDVADAATSRANIGANKAILTRHNVPINADGTVYMPLPVACTIKDIRTAVEGATTTTGAATLTAQIDGTPITSGVVTVAIGAVVGEKDSATPSAANVATEGQNLEFVVAANGQDAAALVSIAVEIEY